MRKRIIIRITLMVVLILIGISLYTIGKEHKVFIDNKDIAVGEIVYSAEATYDVRVDNQEIGLLEKGDRNVVKVAGASHNDSATVNIPAMINNKNEWINKTN